MKSADDTSTGPAHEVPGDPEHRSSTSSSMPLRVGIDLVQVSRIAESLEAFGERFTHRLFTSAEIAYSSQVPNLAAERFAARFAAKEATIKALRLTDGVDWRQIEVSRTESGACDLVLHEDVARRTGPCTLAVSMSHAGDFATAVVVAQFAPSRPLTLDFYTA